MKFNDLTKYQIGLLSDETKTTDELSAILDCGRATVSRWRVKLGIKISRGRKSAKNGGIYETNSFYKPCPVCNKGVLYQPRQTDLTKCCSRGCLFKYDVYRKKLIDNVGGRINSGARPKSTTPAYKRYQSKVHRLSDKAYKKNRDLINPRNYPRTRCGVDGGWQLDHIISVRESYDNGVSAQDASQLSNLRMLPWRENLKRNRITS